MTVSVDWFSVSDAQPSTADRSGHRSTSASRDPAGGGLGIRTIHSFRRTLVPDPVPSRPGYSLLNLDPELGALLAPERLAAARVEITVAVHRVATGSWP